MASKQSVERRFPGTSIQPNTIAGLSGAIINGVLSASICAVFLGVETLLTDIGCWHFIAYTSSLLAGIGMLFTRYHALLPGNRLLSKLPWVAGVMFAVYASGTLLPTVPPITQPLGVGVNLIYFSVSIAVVLTTMIAVHRFLTGTDASTE